jgi:hypothetical protein
MTSSPEHIYFTKGLDKARRMMAPAKYKAFKMRLCKILGVTDPSNLSRHANAKLRTPHTKVLKIQTEFLKEGIESWRGKKKPE